MVRFRWSEAMSVGVSSGADVHIGEHRGFGHAVQALRDRHRDVADPAIIADLLVYLTEWLSHHILIQDMAYKPFVTDLDAAEASVQAEHACVMEMALAATVDARAAGFA